MGKHKTKLKSELVFFVILIAIIATVLITVVSSKTFSYTAKKTTIKELEQTALFIKNNIDFNNIDDAKLYDYSGVSSKRITIININGSVEFESDKSIIESTNHIDRKEVKEAITSSKGYDVRQSASTNTPLLYYAEKIDDNHILRLATPLEEITEWRKQFLLNLTPTIVVILAVALLFSLVIITKLTNMLNDMSASLNKKAKQLNQLEKIRKDFVANVSHELKTPLTAIEGFSELLLNTPDDKDTIKEYTNIIYKNSLQMENIVKDLLLLSSLESETFSLKKEETSIENIIKEVKENVHYKIKEKNITLNVDIDNNVPKNISVNEHLIVQAITNLVINAIIYSDKNESVNLVIQKDKTGIKFVVKDNGCGIPKEEQSRIFERFYRIDKARSRTSGGTGLGLSIVKHIATLHGGTISVYSLGTGMGSMFTLQIPQD